MAILHTATRLADFYVVDSIVVSNTTDTSTIDGSYITHGITGQTNGTANTELSITHAEPATDYWIHFNWDMPNGIDGGCDGWLFDVYDASNNKIFQLDALNGYFLSTVIGDTTDNSSITTYQVGTLGIIETYDIKITVTASNIVAELYVDQVSQGTATVANTTSGFGKPVKIDFVYNDIVGLSLSAGTVSEIILADEDTRGYRLAELSLASAGNYSDFTGTLASQFDNNNNTILISNTAGDRTSGTLSTYGGVTSGYEIVDVRISSLATKTETSGVTNLKHFARISSTDYDNTTAHTLTSSACACQSSWPTNPNTSSAWTFGDLSTLELGIKVET